MSTMPVSVSSRNIAMVVDKNSDAIFAQWTHEMASSTRRADLIKDVELRSECAEFLRSFKDALNVGAGDFKEPAWDRTRELLGNISKSRAMKGFTPSETAVFVFSLKPALFAQIQKGGQSDPVGMAANMVTASQLLDAMGLYTTEVYQQSREEVIRRQQEELLELSTPVVKLWDGVLALPVIGTLDSARTQVVMESLLQAIVATNSRVAIIDITGVPTVDTVVAQHLLKTVTATRLMGADCIISGVRPQIAQTIVHLGINLADVATKATLAGAFQLALQKLGVTFVKASGKA